MVSKNSLCPVKELLTLKSESSCCFYSALSLTHNNDSDIFLQWGLYLGVNFRFAFSSPSKGLPQVI